jgi:hypothetical protein
MTTILKADPSLSLRMTESVCHSERSEETAVQLAQNHITKFFPFSKLLHKMTKKLTADPSLLVRMTEA